MPSRNNAIIRRDINRLNDLVKNQAQDRAALTAIAGLVAEAAEKVNTAWQAYQAVSVRGDRERDERDTAISSLGAWIQSWRPVIMIRVPGAEAN